MKLGLITDVHEHVENLHVALDVLRAEEVDRFVFIGDVFCTGSGLRETCRVLAEADVVGVWGNHDFGLSHEPNERVRERHSGIVLDYMGSLRPSLEVGGCHFAHVEPWLDPHDIADLWFFGGMPVTSERRDRIFAAVPHRVVFGGHYHRWLLARPERLEEWSGEEPVRLDDGRWFVVVAALCDGWFATYDTETGELVPHRVEHAGTMTHGHRL